MGISVAQVQAHQHQCVEHRMPVLASATLAPWLHNPYFSMCHWYSAAESGGQQACNLILHKFLHRPTAIG